MIIQLDEKTRIFGNSAEWVVEKLRTRKGAEEWQGTNYFPSLEYALQFAFEKQLRSSTAVAATLDDYVDELNRCKGEILAAMRVMTL